MKHVLVTGATGFSGRHLCTYLKSRGYQVTAAYHRKRPFFPSKIHQVRLDLEDLTNTLSVMRQVKPQYMIHLAAFSIPHFSWKQEKQTFAINTFGTINLLEAIRRKSSKTRLLMVSSAQVYGKQFHQGKALHEKDLLWPDSPYAVSKALAELACMNYGARYGLDFVIARPFNHLGKGQPEGLAFSDWCRQIVTLEKKKRNGKLNVGNTRVWRELIHVEDVVRAYELLIRKGTAGEVYNISMQKPQALAKYVAKLREFAKVKISVHVEKKRVRKNDPYRMIGSNKKIKALGWRVLKSPEESVEEMLDDWRERQRG